MKKRVRGRSPCEEWSAKRLLHLFPSRPYGSRVDAPNTFTTRVKQSMACSMKPIFLLDSDIINSFVGIYSGFQVIRERLSKSYGNFLSMAHDKILRRLQGFLYNFTEEGSRGSFGRLGGSNREHTGFSWYLIKYRGLHVLWSKKYVLDSLRSREITSPPRLALVNTIPCLEGFFFFP